MKTVALILALASFAVLPSCMHPVDKVLNARATQKQMMLEQTGAIASGACDDVGQYIPGAMRGQRLTMDIQPSPTAVAWTR